MKAAIVCVVLGLLSLQAQGLSMAPEKLHLADDPPAVQENNCPMFMCMMHCKDGFQKGPDGCDICKCNEASVEKPVKCEPVRCRMLCKHGWAKDENGCEICRCAKTGFMVTPGPKHNNGGGDICSLPKVTGRCRAMLRSWYYNGEKCDMFTYGGCGGNGNRFRTEAECKKACQKDGVTDHKKEECPAGQERVKCLVNPCKFAKCPAYPKAKCIANYCGGCKAEFVVPSFSYKMKMTKRNVTALCHAKNTTATIPMKWSVPNECKMPKVVGTCEAAMSRWFYNEEAGECQPFNYGGCGGNKNNFKYKSQCQRRCENGNTYQYATTPGYNPYYYNKYNYNYKSNKQEKDDKFESVKRLANLAEQHGIIPADAPRNMTRDHHPSYPDNMKVCLCY